MLYSKVAEKEAYFLRWVLMNILENYIGCDDLRVETRTQYQRMLDVMDVFHRIIKI